MASGSFFGGISNGVRMPEVVMNQGPLPPLNTGGLPYGLNGTPDARINYNSTLLGDIEPYAYGEPDRLSTQNGYLNIPLRIQKIIPRVKLPSGHHDENIELSHSVDDGDICFAIQGEDATKFASGKPDLDRYYTHKNYHPFLNLATVNYLLAGFMLMRSNALPPNIERNWKQFFETLNPIAGKPNANAETLIADMFRPFGIAHGSEKQGGNHEGTLNPVIGPTNFVTTMVIDGKVQNLANIWRCCDVRAGDRLILKLEKVKMPSNYEFVLNHYSKHTVKERFSFNDPAKVEYEVYQFVPAVQEGYSRELFWNIALSYVKSKKSHFKENDMYGRDDRYLSGALLEACFEPRVNFAWLAATTRKLPNGLFLATSEEFAGEMHTENPGKIALTSLNNAGISWHDIASNIIKNSAVNGSEINTPAVSEISATISDSKKAFQKPRTTPTQPSMSKSFGSKSMNTESEIKDATEIPAANTLKSVKSSDNLQRMARHNKRRNADDVSANITEKQLSAPIAPAPTANSSSSESMQII